MRHALVPILLAAAFAGAADAAVVPPLSSLPGARATLFLDFDGEPSRQDTPPSGLDATAVREVWSRVSDKFAPFNLNVTTVDPGDRAYRRTAHVLIGGDGAWNGGGGGTAATGGFTRLSDAHRTAYVFEENLARVGHVAECAAHEAGHLFGLSHQSVLDGSGRVVEQYNPGDASAAPVMGVSYFAARGLWWVGPNNGGVTQDDLVNLGGDVNGFGFRTDDHGGEAGTATALASGAAAGGVIERPSDVDVFALPADARYVIGLPPGAMLSPVVSESVIGGVRYIGIAGGMSGDGYNVGSYTIEVVPEPGWILAAFAGLALMRRRNGGGE